MNGLRSTYGHGKVSHARRVRLAVQLMCAVLACAPAFSGQPLYESVSYSVGADGTIYATGVTNAPGMQQHSASVETVIESPNGRGAEGYQSVSSGGYAVANASLAFDQTDLGQYTIYAYGCAT